MCAFCFLLLVILASIAMFIMGALCLAKDVYDACGSRNGATTMVVVAVICKFGLAVGLTMKRIADR